MLLSGKIDPQIFFASVLGFSIVAATTDILFGKIFNAFILVMLASALSLAYWSGGWSLVLQGALGIGAGLLLYGWMFGLGFMGGGDVKFLMALGAWGGPYYATEVAILSILLGGACAIGVLIFKKRLGSFYHRLHYSALTLLLKDMKFEAPELDKKMTMPFGVPMAIAAIWAAYASPLRGLL